MIIIPYRDPHQTPPNPNNYRIKSEYVLDMEEVYTEQPKFPLPPKFRLYS